MNTNPKIQTFIATDMLVRFEADGSLFYALS